MNDREVLDAVMEGPIVREVPQGATPAKPCKCETPWLERQEDGTAHCIGCGRDYRP